MFLNSTPGGKIGAQNQQQFMMFIEMMRKKQQLENQTATDNKTLPSQRSISGASNHSPYNGFTLPNAASTQGPNRGLERIESMSDDGDDKTATHFIDNGIRVDPTHQAPSL